ncbi:hypothetical protein VPH35_088378 [Triticum aestivum]
MWHRRRALCRQEAGSNGGHDSPTSSERRLIPPNLFGLCFRCFKEGHRQQDCTNDPMCIRCGLLGHVSAQCKRPRSPISKDELRGVVIAKVSNSMPGRAAGTAGMGGLLLEPGQSAAGAPPLSDAPSFSPMVTVPSPNPMVAALPLNWGLPEVCVVSRAEDMNDLERRLQLAMVMYVGGARPPMSCEEATVTVAAELRLSWHQFSVHKYHPEDFLVVFSSHDARNKALSSPVIRHLDIQLHSKLWLRQAQATSRLMRCQVDVLIEGILAHAWSICVAAELLGKACLIESLAPETENREDLLLFKLRAWCVDPDDVSVSRRLWIPEPPEPAPIAADQRSSYRQLMELGSSSGGSGQSELPDSSPESFAGGDWMVSPWTCGVCDDRGGGQGFTGGGSGGRSYMQALQGRVGPSLWCLSPMARTATAAFEVQLHVEVTTSGTMQLVAANVCGLTTSGDMQMVLHREDSMVQHLEEGLSAKERMALGNIKSFCAGLLKKLASPLLKEIETIRGVRTGQDPFTPRRNTRGALDQLRVVFDSPLREPQLKAIAAIFGKALPVNFGNEMESTIIV